MNEARASRYHRARRRITAAALLVALLVLSGLLTSGASVALHGTVGGSAGLYAVILLLAVETALLPLACLRVLVIERGYGLADVGAGAWWRDSIIHIALSAAFAFVAAELLYVFVRAWPSWWWAPAAGVGVLLTALATALAPALLLRISYRSGPLPPGPLRDRLSDLTARVGADVAIHQCSGASAPRRARASLAGAAGTRRILLSSRVLEDFTDEEIEMMVAHELGHHVNRDLLRSLAAELVVLLAGLLVAARMLEVWWMPLGLVSAADPAGLPLIVLAAGAVRIGTLPFLNAWSRRAERRADRFALEMVPRPDAFVAAVRRMAARNLAEERPSRAAFWLCHTHPTAEQRIADAEAAQRGAEARDRRAGR